MISRVICILTGIKSFRVKRQCSWDVITGSGFLEADEGCSNLATQRRLCAPEVSSVPFRVFILSGVPVTAALALNHEGSFSLREVDYSNKDALTQAMGRCWSRFEPESHGEKPGKAVRGHDRSMVWTLLEASVSSERLPQQLCYISICCIWVALKLG